MKFKDFFYNFLYLLFQLRLIFFLALFCTLFIFLIDYFHNKSIAEFKFSCIINNWVFSEYTDNCYLDKKIFHNNYKLIDYINTK